MSETRTINVDLQDICNYLLNVAANHATRTSRSRHAAHGGAEEQIAFVLRRCVEELIHIYDITVPASRTDQPYQSPIISNETYRNRATL